eukprot:95801_1
MAWNTCITPQHILIVIGITQTILLISCAIIYLLDDNTPQIIINQLLFKVGTIHDSCTNSNPYPNTYYRRRINDTNASYYHVYGVKIGQILSQHLSSSQIETYSSLIAEHLLTNRKQSRNDPSSRAYRIMYQIYVSYYKAFQQNQLKPSPCHSESVDFFKFLQFESEYTNTKRSNLTFYAFQPIQHFYDFETDEYFARIPPNVSLHDAEYATSPIFSYVVSVSSSGALDTLQLRFGEIRGMIQNDNLKHLILNGMRNKLLWCGELYHIYDQKFGKYVLVMDSASGHFKPNISKIPFFLDSMLTKTLFADFVDKNDSYKPLRLISLHTKPWNKAKKVLFPITRRIRKRDKMLNRLSRGIRNEQVLGVTQNVSCVGALSKVAYLMVDLTEKELRNSLQHITKRLDLSGIVCNVSFDQYFAWILVNKRFHNN